MYSIQKYFVPFMPSLSLLYWNNLVVQAYGILLQGFAHGLSQSGWQNKKPENTALFCAAFSGLWLKAFSYI